MLRAAAWVAVGLVVATGARAQARGPSVQDVEARVNPDGLPAHATGIDDLDAWLRRLVGRFVVVPGGARVDCVAVGSGPGVSCAIGYVGSDSPPQAPTLSMYGIDPDLPGIRTLRVSGISVADHVEGGRLRDNKVIFGSACPLPPRSPFPPSIRRPPIPVSCWHQISILAAPGGATVKFRVKTETVMMLPQPPMPPGGLTPPKYDRFRTSATDIPYEWQRLPDDDPGLPVLQLQAVALESLQQYGRMELPELAGHVVDLADRVAPALRAELEASLAAYEAQTRQRIIVFTVQSLGADSIDVLARDAATAWRLGDEENSNYIVVAVAPNDGATRIELGEDARECVDDGTAQQILEEVMIPELRYERVGEGIAKGVAGLISACREALRELEYQ